MNGSWKGESLVPFVLSLSKHERQFANLKGVPFTLRQAQGERFMTRGYSFGSVIGILRTGMLRANGCRLGVFVRLSLRHTQDRHAQGERTIVQVELLKRLFD